jgi:hypothetical protein
MTKNTKLSGPFAETPSWNSLVLICKDCRRRKDGPRHLKAKVLAASIKSQLKAGARRPRVVLTTCLKLCPKKATSVAFVTALAAPQITAIRSSAQLQAMLPEIIGVAPQRSERIATERPLARRAVQGASLSPKRLPVQ